MSKSVGVVVPIKSVLTLDAVAAFAAALAAASWLAPERFPKSILGTAWSASGLSPKWSMSSCGGGGGAGAAGIIGFSTVARDGAGGGGGCVGAAVAAAKLAGMPPNEAAAKLAGMPLTAAAGLLGADEGAASLQLKRRTFAKIPHSEIGTIESSFVTSIQT